MPGFSPEAEQWYGWQMLPGYTSDRVVAYFSPIYVQKVRQRPGTRRLTLTFFNALYAEGVQGFIKDLSLIRRAENYLVGALIEDGATPSDRVAIMSEICPEWLQQHCPNVWSVLPRRPSQDDPPDALQHYLHELYGGGV